MCIRDSPSRSQGELRRIDFDPDCAGATLSDFAASESTRKPLASSVQIWHFPGQKLRLGGDALGADPTYLLYLPSRSRGGLRRIDFGPWPRTAVSPPQSSPESTRKPLLHTRGISRARSFDLEVTPWAPARLTSCISHPGPEESSGASTWAQTAQARP